MSKISRLLSYCLQSVPIGKIHIVHSVNLHIDWLFSCRLAANSPTFGHCLCMGDTYKSDPAIETYHTRKCVFAVWALCYTVEVRLKHLKQISMNKQCKSPLTSCKLWLGCSRSSLARTTGSGREDGTTQMRKWKKTVGEARTNSQLRRAMKANQFGRD